MIVAAAVSPHPPLLFRELTGRRDVAASLRDASLAAVRGATAPDVGRVVVLGGAARSGAWDPALPADVRGFGTTGPRPPDGTPHLPLSLGVGTRLLGDAGWDGPRDLLSVAWDASPAEIAQTGTDLASSGEPTALLVLGDGSARRGDKAPGYLDERAFAFDEALAQALAAGDPHALLALDRGLAAELMADGLTAFQVLAAAVRAQETAVDAQVLYQDDPFGVMYLVALWRLLPAG